MSEADEDKPKHCNLASMLYDLGLLFLGRRTLHRDIYKTIVLLWNFTTHGCLRLRQKSDNGS